MLGCFFFFQAEDGIRDLVRSRGLGDVYKRQVLQRLAHAHHHHVGDGALTFLQAQAPAKLVLGMPCLLYTSDAADERSSVDLGGRRIL